MKNPFTSLFAKSPFGPMHDHINKVNECINLLPQLLDNLKNKNYDELAKTAKLISQSERMADEVKNNIRENLPKSIFLPIDRKDILTVLHVQDNIADYAEDLGVLLTMKHLTIPSEYEVELFQLLDKVKEVFSLLYEIWTDLDTLFEVAFEHDQAMKILTKINQLNYLEHQADKIQDTISKKFYEIGDKLPQTEFFLWTKVIIKLGDIANVSEKSANLIRLFIGR